MKKKGNFILVVYGMMCLLCLTSCEQPEGGAFINTNEQAGFLSTTGNSDTVFEEVFSEKKPEFYRHFDATLSKEEVLAEFDLETQDFISISDKMSNSRWFYKVLTFTGTKARSGTKGNVSVSVTFDSDKGVLKDRNIELKETNDDRKGGWDIYLFSVGFSEDSLKWVEAQKASISLKGTDEWFLEYFEVSALAIDQNISATGRTKIVSEPELWLDNTCKNCWDTYYTNIVGTGRLIF